MIIFLILLLISFLQVTIIPLELILLILISRSFIVEEKFNFWLAFLIGLVLSLLTGYPLGFLSLLYLFVVKLTSLIKKLTFTNNWFSILPITLFFLIMEQGIKKINYGINWNLQTLIIETILILPVYLIVRFWEERFIPQKEIRLKVGK